MIIHSGKGKRVLRRSTFPVPPFFARSWVSPYAPLARSGWYPAINHFELTGSAVQQIEVSVADGPIPIDVEGPTVVDLTGPQESVFQRGSVMGKTPGQETIVLINPEIELPESVGEAIVVVSTWPLWLDQIEMIAKEASERGTRFGLFVPLMVPATTELSVLDELCRIAQEHGAEMVSSELIDLTPPARKALLDRLERVDSETWSMAYDQADHQLVSLSASRHLAARAREAGMRWWIERSSRDNWGAASHLSRIGVQMGQLGRSPELAADFNRAASAIVSMGHDVSTVAASASLTIVENVSDLAEDCVLDWLERGTSSIAEEVDEEWCLRRDLSY